jgi:hypothetical protein
VVAMKHHGGTHPGRFQVSGPARPLAGGVEITARVRDQYSADAADNMEARPRFSFLPRADARRASRS